MQKTLHLSYAMTRLYNAVHRAQSAESPKARAQAAKWARAWNLFIQSGLEQLHGATVLDADLYDDQPSYSAGHTLH